MDLTFFTGKGASVNQLSTLTVHDLAPIPATPFVGSSPQLLSCLSEGFRAVDDAKTLIVTGDTGTGKDLLARVLHQYRSGAPEQFRRFACGDLEERDLNRLQGLLCGRTPEKSLLTLYFDEIDELTPGGQVGLWTLLSDFFWKNFASRGLILISASQKPLQKLATQGRFRVDLLDRLGERSVSLPSLRQMPMDIPAITHYHLQRETRQHGLNPKLTTAEFLAGLQAYPWPGNVRELVNSLRQSVFAAGHEPRLYHKHLPMNIRVHLHRSCLHPVERVQNELVLP